MGRSSEHQRVVNLLDLLACFSKFHQWFYERVIKGLQLGEVGILRLEEFAQHLRTHSCLFIFL